MAIPKKLHFVWIGPDMPEWAERNIAEFQRLNRRHKIMVHGVDVLLDAYRAKYTALPESSYAQRSDLLRLSALQTFGGGWFFDCDFWPVRPLDDIEHAYGLDGSRMFVTEQRGTLGKVDPIANGILACGKTWAGWDALNDALDAVPKRAWCGTGFGPKLIGGLFRAHRDLFEVGRYGWFYPVGLGQAAALYRRLAGGESATEVFAALRHQTNGQLPFVFHQWQGGKADLIEKDIGAFCDVGATEMAGVNVGIIATARQQQDASQPFRAVKAGFEKLGCNVVMSSPESKPLFLHNPSIVVCWNGRRAPYAPLVRAARTRGAVVLLLEHGFFDRRAYTQVDHQDILHWASWADDWDTAPLHADGADRLRSVWPKSPVPFRRNRKGYVLVLGQVPGDSQLDDSDVSEPAELIRLVAGSLPPGMEIRYRPHPRIARDDTRIDGVPLCESGTLAEAIRGAKFAVTINSNAGNECLALGCPVLAFGPAGYLKAGVARPAGRSSIANDLLAMSNGCRPSTAAVRAYLERLACRQWSCDELADGTILAKLMDIARRAAAPPKPETVRSVPPPDPILARIEPPAARRTGYGFVIGSAAFRANKTFWRRLLATLQAGRLPVKVKTPGPDGTARFSPQYNCIIDQDNALTLAAELGVSAT